jgi:hypothetical protein
MVMTSGDQGQVCVVAATGQPNQTCPSGIFVTIELLFSQETTNNPVTMVSVIISVMWRLCPPCGCLCID